MNRNFFFPAHSNTVTFTSIKTKYNGVEPKMTKSYVHITSPIRRLVDLLNQMFLFNRLSLVTIMSNDATAFLNKWMQEMEYINANLTTVTLEHLEDVPEIVNNPIPYVILF
jgi:hypothetical protein